MKYILKRAEYLNPINEIAGNDSTWGGSLLGRLINSVIRIVKIKIDGTQIDPIIKQIKSELENLLVEYSKEKDMIENFAAIKLLMDMVDAIEQKKGLEVFLGNENEGGLIDATLKVLNRLENFPDKAEVVQKLKEFKKLLEDMSHDASDEAQVEKEVEKTEEAPKEETQKEPETKDTKKLFRSIQNASVVATKNIIGLVSDLSHDTVKSANSEISNFIKDAIFIQGEKDKQSIAMKIQQTYNRGKAISKSAKDGGSKYNQDELKSFVKYFDYVTKIAKQLHIINEAKLGALEGDAANAYNKMKAAVKSSGIDKYTKQLSSLISDIGELADDGANIKKKQDNLKNLVKIFRLVVKYNETTPKMSFSQLIKEGLSEDIAKCISLFIVPILAFKDDVNLMGSYGASSAKIKAIYSAMTQLPKMLAEYDSLAKGNADTEQATPATPVAPVTEANENDTESTDADKSKGEDVVDAIPVEGNTDKNDIRDAGNKLASDIEKNIPKRISDAWRTCFTEKQESEWKVVYDKIDSTAKDFKGGSQIDVTAKNPDPIIRIVNLYSKAYDLIVTPKIPSGRPGEKVSQNTMNQYTYLGEKGTVPKADSAGDYGPWAVKSLYNKFNNAIMKMMEDTELRKILASPTMTINGKKEAGKTLFTFISDLTTRIRSANFDIERHKLLQTYFGIDSKKDKDLDEIGHGNIDNKKVAKEDIDPNTLIWKLKSQLTKKELLADLDDSFFSFKVKSEENQNQKAATYRLVGHIMYPDKQHKEYLLFKFQTKGQEIPDLYLSGRKETVEKIATIANNRNQEVYIGVLDLNKIGHLKPRDKFKFTFVSTQNQSDETKYEVREVSLVEMRFLCEVNPDGQSKFIKTGFESATKTPRKDKKVQSGMITKLSDKLNGQS
jgi:hypothetical protein